MPRSNAIKFVFSAILRRCSHCLGRKRSEEFHSANHSWCRECLNGHTRIRRAQAKPLGFCERCFKHPQAEDSRWCPECIERVRFLWDQRKDKACRRCGTQRLPPTRRSGAICPECNRKKAKKEKHFLILKKLCVRCRRNPATKGQNCFGCAEQISIRGRARYRKIRAEVFAAYGGAKCSCCGEQHIEFLSIDHIDGGGKKHIRSLGSTFYFWLKKNNFPPRFRVLCMNCNHAIGRSGGNHQCPHQREAIKFPQILGDG